MTGSFPGGSDGKASAYSAGDLGSIPGLGRSPGEGNGNSLQNSCLENPMDRGAWQATVHGVAKSQTRLSDFTFTFHYRGLECKSRKSRDTWSTGKFGLGVQNEAGQRLTEFCQENALVVANTLFQQHKTQLYTQISPDGQNENKTDDVLCRQRW